MLIDSLIPISRIDISDEFSLSHMLEFSKLAVAFAVELGGRGTGSFADVWRSTGSSRE